MTAMRILLLVLGLAVVGLVAKYALSGSLGPDAPGKSQPAKQLDNVRERAHQLEGEMQRGADKAEKVAE